VFLRALPGDISADRLRALDARYHLTATGNDEISMYWLPRLVAGDVQTAAPAVRGFLARVGRRRMVKPLFEALMAGGEEWRRLARATFEQVAPRYHPITRATVAKILAGL
jgi:hypothetical protein